MSTALLLAEPQAETRGFLERHLTNDGFKVVDAEARPDLVLLGDTAALDACRARHGDVPVIVLGEPESDTVDRVRALDRGCDDFLAKPFDYEELLGAISIRQLEPISVSLQGFLPISVVDSHDSVPVER
jgi:DNA-binding response OmpR family regulator